MKALLHIAARSAWNRRGTLMLVVLSIALATALLLAASAWRVTSPVAFTRKPERYTALDVLLALPLWMPLRVAVPPAVIKIAEPPLPPFDRRPLPVPVPVTVPVMSRSLVAAMVVVLSRYK